MIRIDDAVITAQTLEGRLAGERQVEIGPGSKLTPSAQDFLHAQGVEIVRGEAGEVPTTPTSVPAPAPAAPRAAGRQAFAGIFCPNIVLFDSQNRINHAEMERYINWLIEAGIHGLYPNGSTGEFARLSQEERQDVVRLVCEVNKGRVPVLAGASEANLRDVLKMAEYYASLGVDAIALMPPLLLRDFYREPFRVLRRNCRGIAAGHPAVQYPAICPRAVDRFTGAALALRSDLRHQGLQPRPAEAAQHHEPPAPTAP